MPESPPPNPTFEESATRLRWLVYSLLIITSLAGLTGRIMAVMASTGETPMLSANDRSRWCTVRSLGDHGTYQIDRIIVEKHPETKRRFWHTIDRVRHKGKDGREHDYSSKPPLFPTLLAGQYWIIKRVTGMRLDEHPEYVMRMMLVITNVLPLAVYFVLIGFWIDRLGVSDGGRIFVMAAATWGTFLTTFGVTLNNHVPGAICALVAVLSATAIWRCDDSKWWWFAACGFFAAFAAACEQPA